MFKHFIVGNNINAIAAEFMSESTLEGLEKEGRS